MSDEESEQKRKADVLEIDIDAPEPLSKKQKRLLKKGVIDENKKRLKKGPSGEPTSSSNKSAYAVWIGNLTYDTTKEELRKFITSKCSDVLTDRDITRINMPKQKGFAYVDFNTEEQMDAVIGLSESALNGRKLLIKNAASFEGRPKKEKTDRDENLGKNPPSRILFIGNLAFDTTEQDVETLFQHCGEISKIRMATFEDSGNCKGFCFVDFKDTETATKALKDKTCRRLKGRQLRMEFGEDRSQRKVRPQGSGSAPPSEAEATNDNSEESNNNREREERPAREHRPKPDTFKKNTFSASRKSPGLALATAQRGKTGIVPSQGKKITFG